ncbi:active breakpoint cluster region-related protein-like protein [Leptotrombidium deliense]|uniref:Active breakpoint cluster region-related protein-like protein n=1 Tax=Leptotrombidium deliense TaxID=299467 RepID=A0A443SV86_9ACAR|nr:active breakpoint cluster region-related protein-like protein [Leptotrombidium deliense]
MASMNVFKDFQKEWSRRFPDNDLPKAWEDDVRSNLDKHRHKLQLLKEEMEKEEFYVQYLERLLKDVETTKRETTQNDSVASVKSGTADPYVTVITVSSFSDMEKKSLPDNPLHQDSKHKQQSTVCSSNQTNNVSETENAASHPIDQPIIIDTQPKKIFLEPAVTKKKRPPTPPRKPKINRNNFPGFLLQKEFTATQSLPVQPQEIADNSNNTRPVIEPVNHVKPETNSETTLIPEEPAYAVKDISLLNEPAYAVKELSLLTNVVNDIPCVYNTESVENVQRSNEELCDKSEEETSVVGNIINSECATDDDKEIDETEECIYDTVAPDELSLSDHQEEDMNNLNKLPPLLERNLTSSYLLRTKYDDINSSVNYVNLDYFLRRDEASSKNDSDDNETHVSHSISSDHDTDEGIDKEDRDSELKNASLESAASTYDEVFDPVDYGVYLNCNIFYLCLLLAVGYYADSDACSPNSQQPSDCFDDEEARKAEAERMTMYRCILSSVVESETVYIDCLNTLIQYKKALKSTTETSHPLCTSEDLEIIFFKINDLYNIHNTFLEGCRRLSTVTDTSRASDDPTLGDLFKVLASRLGAYSAYLKNYSHALESVHKCCVANNQFSEITRAIKLKSMKGQTTTLEELLHKPVARVQKNALVLHDLLKYTKENDEEYKAVKTALKMTQCFLNELNIAATEQMFPDKTQRRLVKESFIIEFSEGRRKLRHLFLFNDIIVCAKYKPSTRQKFTFDVKWYALLLDVTIPQCDDLSVSTIKGKEPNSEIISLKCKLNSIRDLMMKEVHSSSLIRNIIHKFFPQKSKTNNKLVEKLRKKQADLEGQLVLLLPQLHFVICNKHNKSYTFYLSSEFERTQWIESISVLQASGSQGEEQINFNELQAWIETCRKGLRPSLGSFLLRTSKDEDLLHGDLYLTIHTLKGITRRADLFLMIECDTYGHFFQKAQTRTVRDSLNPQFNQEFVIDLDGSRTLRILCYEDVIGQQKPCHRGKSSIELSRSWLHDNICDREIAMLDSTLSVSLKFIPSEASTIRFPARKLYGAFGVNIQTVSRREKSTVPYLIVACVREVERRGMKEVGIYRVSGLTSDLQKLKKAFENNPYEAEFLLKDIDIHAVTGLLKMYLRELPEALFTNNYYKKFFDAFSLTNQEEKKKKLIDLFAQLPQINQNTINFLIDHLSNVNQHETLNKMSLHNLATVFGPTLIRPGSSSSGSSSEDQFTAGTIDVMAQAGILYFFLKRKVCKETNC